MAKHKDHTSSLPGLTNEVMQAIVDESRLDGDIIRTTTIEKEFAKIIGCSDVVFSDDDCKAIAETIYDAAITGQGFVIKKRKGYRHVDARHVKIDLDMRKA
jgi:hypothetical protein